MKQPLIVISGPTASGKSALALQMAEQYEKTGGAELVSADSAQVYIGMDIGTAKPDQLTRARVAHHLIDLIEPTEAYSAARFVEDALAAIAAIQGRGKVPIVVGGTMLYLKALLEGLSDLPQADSALRAELDAEASLRGWPAMHAQLAKIDPQTAARLKPTDAQRIQRALEVWRLTGVPLSELQGRRQAALTGEVRHIALMPEDRAWLHQRIAERFDAMLAAGLVEEVQGLRERYQLQPTMASMRCVGYRQVWGYLEGEYDYKTMREKGIAATRQLAKRQMTWVRNQMSDVRYQVSDVRDQNLNHE